MGVKVLINVVSSFPTVPVVTKADDLEKGILYLPIAISAALLFIVMIILTVVFILLRKNHQEMGTWILFFL